MNDFLTDVLADVTGKCIAIAAMLTLIERSLLDDRPTFFVTAGRRGGGKTTLLIMLLTAITGVRPAAAAWSPNEEERRKAVFAYLLEGPPAIVWDNIARGSQISCPHIERSCTSADIQDRILGVSERASSLDRRHPLLHRQQHRAQRRSRITLTENPTGSHPRRSGKPRLSPSRSHCMGRSQSRQNPGRALHAAAW